MRCEDVRLVLFHLWNEWNEPLISLGYNSPCNIVSIFLIFVLKHLFV